MRRLQKIDGGATKREEDRSWSLLTPHAHVLLCIAKDPDTRVREIAEAVEISERGAHQIVADLVDAGFIRRMRVGRRNRYAIEEKSSLKHGPVKHRRIGSIIALLGPEPARAATTTTKAATRSNGPASRTRRVSGTDVTKKKRAA